jgi:hypothetical protein
MERLARGYVWCQVYSEDTRTRAGNTLLTTFAQNGSPGQHHQARYG